MPNSLDFFINFDPAGATKGVDQAAKDAKRAAADYRKITAAVGKLTDALDLQRAKVKQQETGLSVLADRLAAAKKKEVELAQAVARGEKVRAGAVESASHATKKLAAQYEVQEAKVRGAVAEEKRLADALERTQKEQLSAANASKKATEELKRQEKATKKTSNASKDLAASAKKTAASLLSLAAAKDSFLKGVKYTDELAAVEAIAGATAGEVEKLTEKTYALAGAAGGPTAVAETMAELATAGVSVNDILFGTENVRDMANASRGMLSFGQAGSHITDILNLLGAEMSDSQMVADQLVKGWSSASQTAPELIRGLKEVLGMYSAFYGELDKEEVLAKAIAGISALADVGFKGSKGGRMLKNAFIRLVKPAGAAEAVLSSLSESEKEVAGTATAVLEAHEAQIRVYDEATGKLRDYADIIDDIGKAALSEKESLQLFGAIAGPAMFAQVNKGGQAVRDLEDKMSSAEGTAKKVSETMQDRLGGSLREASAHIEAAQILLVTKFEPALKAVLGAVGYVDNATHFLIGTIETLAATANIGAGAIFSLLGYFEAATDYIGLTNDATNEWQRNADAAFSSAQNLGEQAASSYKKAKDEIDPLAESQDRLAWTTATLTSRYSEISKETEVTITSMSDLDAAVQRGTIRYDEASARWVGAEKEKRTAAQETAKQMGVAQNASKKSVEKFIEGAEKTEKAAKKTYEEITKQIRELDQAVSDLGGLGEEGAEGLQKINNEWQRFSTNAGKAKVATDGFNSAALVGTSEVADKVFELSLAGKSDLVVWEARRKATEKYKEAAKGYVDQAKQMAAAGDQAGAERMFDKAREALKKAESSYKSLSKEVKSEWTPAMDAAHKAAGEGVKKYEKKANKALSEAKKHYDKARAAGEKLADKQADLADKLRDIGRAGMTPAAAYQDMARQARKYESAARDAFRAGDFEKAVELAGRAESAWDSLGSEVKDGERTIISARQALTDQAAGIKSAGQVAIDALKAQRAEEEKAAKAAKRRAAKATAAKEAETKKVTELEEEKNKVIISSEEGAQIAAEGTIEVNALLRESYEAQRDSLQEIADTIDDAYNFSGVEESANALKDTLETVGEPLADSIGDAADAAVDDVERITEAVENIPDRTVTVTVKEISASAHGSIVGVPGASTGGVFTGWKNARTGRINPGAPSMVDSIPLITAPGETVTNAFAAAHIGYNVWRANNKGDEIGMAKSLVGNFPYLEKIFSPPVEIKIEHPSNQHQQQNNGMAHYHVTDNYSGRIYEKIMRPEDYEFEQERKARTQFFMDKFKR